MDEFRDLLEELLNGELLQMVFSGQKQRREVTKIRVRPLMVKGTLMFQAAFWDGKKEKHRNYGKVELTEAAVDWMEQDFKQMQADTVSVSASVLVSKKGKVTVKKRYLAQRRAAPQLSHNRRKHYILEEGKPVPFLVELGVMTPEGRVVNSRYDKFRQINRFLEFIEDICPCLPRNRELTMIDFGCGKSYLTFAMYYYLRELRGLDLRIIGLDLKEDVINHCNALARKFGYEKLQFLAGDIADYEGVEQVDLVVTLHACDTATDYALAKAVAWNARAILSVPCCQHELNGQIENEILQPVLRYGLLKERIAALVTDGLRASMLEQQGYEVQVLEFIDMEHTPKNILIRAVKRGGGKYPLIRPAAAGDKSQEAAAGAPEKNGDEELERCMEFLKADPTLYRLLKRGEPPRKSGI
ncbi:MAG: SAM-dependent methyltransferase [Lachnospiraceae bacterium]|nr:SAM-dependent methyltransferase [Lachnospiraceae bacterium]